jgi:hypothetical protein
MQIDGSVWASATTAAARTGWVDVAGKVVVPAAAALAALATVIVGILTYLRQQAFERLVTVTRQEAVPR